MRAWEGQLSDGAYNGLLAGLRKYLHYILNKKFV